MFGLLLPVFKLLQQLLVVAAIESPLALLQKPVKIVWHNAVEATQMPLCLVQKVLHASDMMPPLGHEDLTVVDTSVVKLRGIPQIIRREAIGIDDAIRWHLLSRMIAVTFLTGHSE